MRDLLKAPLPALIAGVALALAAAGCGLVGTTAGQRPPSPSVRTSPPPSQAPSGRASSASPAPRRSTSPAPSSTPARILVPGMKGADVRLLQLRLAALHYYPGAADGQFGLDTEEAVWAFQEVQGLPTSGDVGQATQRALANPQNPAVLVASGPSTRVEINLGRGVLVLYRAGQVALISHVSTGGGYYYCSPGGGCGYAVTPTGDFSTVAFMPGWVTVPLGEMYNPVFFIDTAFAIHGDTYVPLQPVSHGCVRIPMDIAAFFHNLVKVPGTPVYIRR